MHEEGSMIVQKVRSRIHHLLNYRRKVLAIAVASLAAIPVVPSGVSAHLEDSVFVVTFTPGESLESKLKKAAHIRPSDAQVAWMHRERNAFMHYGMNTFHGSDWGSGSENPKDFNPTQQNPDQWAQVLKDAKFSMVVPTVKHHDGFCLWNTATTTQSVKNATVTTDVVDAMHKAGVNRGVDLGIYLSPWDMNQRDHGVWKTAAYNTFFINQLRELLGGAYGAKGTIGELWFDGACGDYGVFYPIPWYTPNVWYDTIEVLQPTAVIRMYDAFYYADNTRWAAIKAGTQKLQWRGKEIRWCGNEAGSARADEWSVQPVYEQLFGSSVSNGTLGQESFYNNAVGAVWYQSELNTSIATDWFWHSQSYPNSVKSFSAMQTLYYSSVGNNENLLLNLMPDNRGIIPDDQINLLKKWNNWIDSTFTKNLAKGATAEASSQVVGHEADKIIDNKRHTYWTPSGTWTLGTSTATVTFTLPSAQTFDHIMLKEYVYDGQRVAGWNVEYQDGTGAWKSLVTGKKVIGYKRICKFNQVTSSKIRLNITRSWDTPEISDFALYKTLSGIDLTPEDTTKPNQSEVMPAVKSASTPVQPKIAINTHGITIDAMGLHISRADIVGLDGRSVPLSIIRGSKAVSRPLTVGVYLVKIQAGDRTYTNKIAVSR